MEHSKHLNLFRMNSSTWKLRIWSRFRKICGKTWGSRRREHCCRRPSFRTKTDNSKWLLTRTPSFDWLWGNTFCNCYSTLLNQVSEFLKGYSKKRRQIRGKLVTHLHYRCSNVAFCRICILWGFVFFFKFHNLHLSFPLAGFCQISRLQSTSQVQLQTRSYKGKNSVKNYQKLNIFRSKLAKRISSNWIWLRKRHSFWNQLTLVRVREEFYMNSYVFLSMHLKTSFYQHFHCWTLCISEKVEKKKTWRNLYRNFCRNRVEQVVWTYQFVHSDRGRPTEHWMACRQHSIPSLHRIRFARYQIREILYPVVRYFPITKPETIGILEIWIVTTS